MAFVWLWQAWRERPREWVASVDSWFDSLDREISLSLTTLDSQLRFLMQQLRAGHTMFGTPVLVPGPLSHLQDIPLDIGVRAVNHLAFGVVANSRIDPPP